MKMNPELVKLTHFFGQTIDNEKTGFMPVNPEPVVAVKHDSGKTNWSLMPFEAVEEINKVLEFGAGKYNEKGKQGPSSWNWAKGSGLCRYRVLNAVFRHLFAHVKGEKLDPESGLPHLNHAACGLIFMIYYNIYPNKYPVDTDS